MHKASKLALDQLRNSKNQWAIAWPSVYEFINVVTHPKIYTPASTMDEALRAIESWTAAGNLLFLHESSDFMPSLKRLLLESQIRGPKVHDARIAAICLHHGVRELWTADRDFSAFPKLKTRNPLKQK
jgi:predicted nucleic acid-binding protein